MANANGRIDWAREKMAGHKRAYEYRASNATAQIERTKDDPGLAALTQEWRSELFHANEMLAVLADLAIPFDYPDPDPGR